MLTEQSRQETAMILAALEFDHMRALDRRLQKFHAKPPLPFPPRLRERRRVTQHAFDDVAIRNVAQSPRREFDAESS
jgi:hypothetical protein